MHSHSDSFLPEGLLVDFPLIDVQHDGIFRGLQTLKVLCVDGGNALSKEFDAVVDLFADHFATEERLAAEAGLDFCEHARIHRETLRLLRRASADAVMAATGGHALLRYCEYWFERHINQTDRYFVQDLMRRRFFRQPGRERTIGGAWSLAGV